MRVSAEMWFSATCIAMRPPWCHYSADFTFGFASPVAGTCDGCQHCIVGPRPIHHWKHLWEDRIPVPERRSLDAKLPAR